MCWTSNHQGQEIFHFSQMSRPAVRPIQPPRQYAPWALPPKGDRQGMELTNHLHLVLRLRFTDATRQLSRMPSWCVQASSLDLYCSSYTGQCLGAPQLLNMFILPPKSAIPQFQYVLLQHSAPFLAPLSPIYYSISAPVPALPFPASCGFYFSTETQAVHSSYMSVGSI
jgi:hypothetical protein